MAQLDRTIGTISTRFVRCGKPQCHCHNGVPHGPYHYHVYREVRDGKRVRVSRYVPANQVADLMAELESRRRLTNAALKSDFRDLKAISSKFDHYITEVLTNAR